MQSREIEFVYYDSYAQQVKISGSFCDWRDKKTMKKVSDGKFCAVLTLPVGHVAFKFIVDGQWKCGLEYPTEMDSSGNENNFINVEASRSEEIMASSNDEEVEEEGKQEDEIYNNIGENVEEPKEQTVYESLLKEPTPEMESFSKNKETVDSVLQSIRKSSGESLSDPDRLPSNTSIGTKPKDWERFSDPSLLNDSSKAIQTESLPDPRIPLKKSKSEIQLSESQNDSEKVKLPMEQPPRVPRKRSSASSNIMLENEKSEQVSNTQKPEEMLLPSCDTPKSKKDRQVSKNHKSLWQKLKCNLL